MKLTHITTHYASYEAPYVSISDDLELVGTFRFTSKRFGKFDVAIKFELKGDHEGMSWDTMEWGEVKTAVRKYFDNKGPDFVARLAFKSMTEPERNHTVVGRALDIYLEYSRELKRTKKGGRA